jgi:hypothetical protein
MILFRKSLSVRRLSFERSGVCPLDFSKLGFKKGKEVII